MPLFYPRAQIDDTMEWLEPDGLGGFASGTATGVRTRRYHALLLAAMTPPTGRVVLVNGVEAEVMTDRGAFSLSSHRYWTDSGGSVVCPAEGAPIESFTIEPWPTWVYRLPGGLRIRHSVIARHGEPSVALCWSVLEGSPGAGRATLVVRPLLSGRDYHGVHRENPAFRFGSRIEPGVVAWHPYPGIPGTIARTNGGYVPDPRWYRRFAYTQETERGFECREDLASPGVFRFDLSEGEGALIFSAQGTPGAPVVDDGEGAGALLERIRHDERRRREALGDRLARSADAYIVRRGSGRTLIAGYPWFTDWGRDTFIAVRGLCMATGRWEDARQVLLAWAAAVADGRMPNRFLDDGGEAEYNTVDAALWFVVAAGEFLRRHEAAGVLAEEDRRVLTAAMNAILQRYAAGSEFGVRLDPDGLIAAGEPGVQLTWMDARVGERVITPRIGKPVEVQALWLNALHMARPHCGAMGGMLERGLASFRRRFVHPAGYLYDVVDVDHRAGEVDETFRPNQVLAVGGLPLCLLSISQARRVVDQVEERLLTPLGLRSLDPGACGYASRYVGGPGERDGVYHQGTAWAWLMGPFVEAWVRVRGSTVQAKRRARRRFLAPLMAHLNEAGLGHVSEIADGAAPHVARGAPFQAWSLGELIRLDREVLAESRTGIGASDASMERAGAA